MKNIASSWKLGVSCILFDSPKFEKLLLIQREREPLKWSYPGGKLEPYESVKLGIEREVYEETGYRVNIIENSLYNVEEFREIGYLVITGMAFLHDVKPQLEGRTPEDIAIEQKLFSLNKKEENNFWDLNDDDCIPNLKIITQRFLDIYKGKY